MSQLEKTEAIVLGTVKYRETSLIVRFYTREFGLLSGLINGVRTAHAKARTGAALFQPMQQLHIIIYYKPDGDLHRISEARLSYNYLTIPYDARKRVVAVFLQEVLTKVLQEQHTSPELYRFITQSLQAYDQDEGFVKTFHLYFMIQLSRFLGFMPGSAQSFFEELVSHKAVIEGAAINEEFDAIEMLLNPEPAYMPNLTRTLRKQLLDHILILYKIHNEGFGNLKSLPVLQSLSKQGRNILQ